MVAQLRSALVATRRKWQVLTSLLVLVTICFASYQTVHEKRFVTPNQFPLQQLLNPPSESSIGLGTERYNLTSPKVGPMANGDTDRKRVSAIVDKSNMGSTGGAWSWCTHLTKYGMNFDLGLATFLAHQLQSTSALEFGCGIGLYVGYLVDHAEFSGRVVGIEPEDMSRAGVFSPDKEKPAQVTGNILLSERLVEREGMGEFDLVYSIEVAEHLPPEVHHDLVSFLAGRTGKFLVFGAARPGQGGTGHVRKSMLERAEWIRRFETAGLKFLPNLSAMLLDACDPKNTNHKRNPFVMGRSIDLDSTVRSPLLRQTPGSTRNEQDVYAQTLFPSVARALEDASHRCV